MQLRRATYFSIVTLSAVLCGCGPHDPKGIKVPPPPAVVPAAPKLVPTSLDPTLRADAVALLQAACDSDNSGNPFMRANALEALSTVDPDDSARLVLKGLSDPEPSVRYAAVMAAGQLRLKLAYSPLLAMVSDANLQVRVAVRFALHRLGDTRFSHDLEKYGRDFDSHVRASTAQVLGLLGEQSAVKLLYALDQDPAPAVRLQAAESLWRLGDRQGLEDLVSYSISQFPDDQIIAILGLAATHDQRVTEHVRGSLTSDYAEVSLAAARAMGMLGSDEGWNVAVPKAKSNDPRQRSLAALAMGAIGRPDLQPVLAPLLKDPDDAVKISAATAILQLHEPG